MDDNSSPPVLTYNSPESLLRRLFWKAVLSSAFLTAILTIGGTWLIETHKTNLILQQERVQNTEKNYENLQNALNGLSKDLGNLTATATLALNSPKEKTLHDATSASLRAVAESLTVVMDARERYGIDTQISDAIREALEPIPPALSKAQSNFESVRLICELYQSGLKSKIHSVQDKIQQKISDMSV